MSKSPKNTKTTGTKSGSRHAKSFKKPVTIDLEAEATKTAKKTAPETLKQAEPTKSSRSSVPKSADAKTNQKKTTASSTLKETKAETDKSAPAKASKSDLPAGKQDNVKKPAQPATKQSSGLGGKFAAAVVGGVVALSGAGALQYFGVLGTPDGTTSAPAENFASVEELNAAKAELAAGLKEISEKQTAAAAAASQTANAEPPAIDEAAIAKIVEEKLAAATPNDTSAELQSTLEKLQSDVQKNSETLSAAASGDTTESVTAAMASIAALKAQIAKLETNSSATADVAERVNAVEQTTEEIASLKEDLGKLQSALDSQNGSIAELAKSVETGPDKKAAMAIAAAALKADVDRGLPFTGPLQTLQSVAGSDTDFSELSKFAEQGVPNTVAIANEFQNEISDAVLVAMAPPADDSLTSRLLAGAKSLVKVKQLSPVTGDTHEAILSRIQAALSESKLQTASEEWKKLPEAGQAVSKEWHEKLLSRIAVNNLIDTTVRSFLLSNAG